jgi:cytochrome bd ubiquinol oxidase subunit I
MDTVIVDRVQFAFTVMFHYLFPIGTIGLAPFIAWYVYRAGRGDAEASAIARFLTKLFALNFAAGVVTGIPMEFQFGTNWAEFSAKSGSIIGQPLAMEGLYAFFLESTFLGVLLYGKNRVPANWYTASAICVWLGSWLSGFFIVATNAWMQHPLGFHVASDGRIELTSIAAVLFSSFAWWQFAHVIVSALLAGGFILAGIGSYYVLARRDESAGRRLVRAGAIVALIASCLVIFPSGDREGHDVTVYQPVKLAAMEGLFESEPDAPLAIIGMPDVATRTLIDPIFVPRILSFLAYGNLSANVAGLSSYPRNLWPPVALTYYAYHVMVGLGTIFIAVSALAVLLLILGRLYTTRLMLWILMLLMPFPYIAIEAGWTTAEVGRQPWIIWGLMRTSEGVSTNVAGGEALFTLIGFTGMYFILGVTFLYLILREISFGPQHE